MNSSGMDDQAARPLPSRAVPNIVLLGHLLHDEAFWRSLFPAIVFFTSLGMLVSVAMAVGKHNPTMRLLFLRRGIGSTTVTMRK